MVGKENFVLSEAEKEEIMKKISDKYIERTPKEEAALDELLKDFVERRDRAYIAAFKRFFSVGGTL